MELESQRGETVTHPVFLLNLESFTTMPNYRPTLLYSGGCKFCRWVVRTIVPLIDRKRMLDLIPIRHPLAERFLGDLAMDQRIANWWFVDPTGHRWAGNKGGAVKLLDQLFYHHVRFAKTTSKLFDALDNWVKAHRPWLSPWVEDGPVRLVVQDEGIDRNLSHTYWEEV